jgi:hypothetical protein
MNDESLEKISKIAKNVAIKWGISLEEVQFIFNKVGISLFDFKNGFDCIFKSFKQDEINLKERNDIQKKNFNEMIFKNNKKSKKHIYKHTKF